jgi:hypothetical protein
LSPFTKVLIILLSLAVMFLCGATITYVATANDWKAVAKDFESKFKSVNSESQMSSQLLNEKSVEYKILESGLEEDIMGLEGEKAAMAVELRTVQRENENYKAQLTSLTNAMTGIQSTVGKLELSLRSGQDQLNAARLASIKNNQHLNETTSMLVEKSVLLDASEAKSRRLLEMKADLESKVTGGYSIVPVDVDSSSVVTMLPSKVVSSQPIVTSVAINGLISEVGQSLVTISIGAADGVAVGMTFHVTRGNNFICDVVVTNTDTNTAAGVLELVSQRPQVGDSVSTGF